MSDINYPSRPLNSSTDSVTVSGTVTTSNPAVGPTGAAVPASADYVGVNVGGTLTGLTGSGSGVFTVVNAALPAGSNTIGAVTQSGTWDVNNISGTISLPTGAATSAKQPALGTSGTASSDVITVQGISGMTALKVDGSGSTQPVSGTVTVQQATAANLNATVTGTVAATQSGTWDINNVSGTVSLPTGAATSAKQPALGISGTPSADVLTVQGSTGMTALKVDGSAVTQPVSGSVTVSGTVAATQSGTWDINNISGTVSLPTGAATSAKQPALGTAGTASADVITVQGVASMTPLLVNGSGSTQPVSIAGRAKVLLYRNDYSSVNVTTSAYVQIVASSAAAINRLYIADTSGSAIILATGGAGSEVDQLYIGPGGSDAPYELNIPASTRISIKALDASATSGQFILTALS